MAAGAASASPVDSQTRSSVVVHHMAAAERELEGMRRGVARDPLSAVGRQNFGVYLFAAGRLEEAKAEFLKARELRSGDAAEVELELIRVLAVQRCYDEALSMVSRLPEGDLHDHGSALLFDAPGQRSEADAALAWLVDRDDAR